MMCSVGAGRVRAWVKQELMQVRRELDEAEARAAVEAQAARATVRLSRIRGVGE